MTRPIHWGRRAAVALLSLCGVAAAAAADKPTTVLALGQNIPLKLIYWEVDHPGGEGLVVAAKSGITRHKDIAKAKTIAAPSVTRSVVMGAYERESGARYPTLAQQLDPASPCSMTAKEGGLAKTLYVASQMLFETGTIPAPLTWEAINPAIEPAYIRQYLESIPGALSAPGVRGETSTQYFTAEEGSWQSFAEGIQPSSYSAVNEFVSHERRQVSADRSTTTVNWQGH